MSNAATAEQPDDDDQPQEHWRLLGDGNLWVKSPEENWRKKVVGSPFRKKTSQAKGEKCGSAKLKASDIPVIRQLYRDGNSYAQIALRYHVNQTTVGRIVSSKTWRDIPDEIGTTPRTLKSSRWYGGAKLNDDKVREIRKAISGGTSIKQIANDYAIDQSVIRTIWNRKAWKHVVDYDEITDRKFSAKKLTVPDIAKIRKMLLDGHTHREIGERFSVSGNTIGDISLGKTWKHVP